MGVCFWTRALLVAWVWLCVPLWMIRLYCVIVVSIWRLFLHPSGQNVPKNCISVTHKHTPPLQPPSSWRLNHIQTLRAVIVSWRSAAWENHSWHSSDWIQLHMESRKWERLMGNVVWRAVKLVNYKFISDIVSLLLKAVIFIWSIIQ